MKMLFVSLICLKLEILFTFYLFDLLSINDIIRSFYDFDNFIVIWNKFHDIHFKLLNFLNFLTV